MDIGLMARRWRERSHLAGFTFAATDPTARRYEAGTEGLVAEILGDFDPTRTCLHLDEILRIRAVQGMPPSAALAFLFDIRPILRESLGPERAAITDHRVDQAALWAFDVYTRCREEVLRLRERPWKGGAPPRPHCAMEST